MGKMMEDFDVIQRNFRFKSDEIFPRIKISLLVALICESAFLANTEPEEPKEAEAPTNAKEAMSTEESQAVWYWL